MVTIIKKGSPKRSLVAALKKFRKKKGINAHKYCGIIRLKEDALIIQKGLRSEWQ